jgi:hypothetical protein
MLFIGLLVIVFYNITHLTVWKDFLEKKQKSGNLKTQHGRPAVFTDVFHISYSSSCDQPCEIRRAE